MKADVFTTQRRAPGAAHIWVDNPAVIRAGDKIEINRERMTVRAVNIGGRLWVHRGKRPKAIAHGAKVRIIRPERPRPEEPKE